MSLKRIPILRQASLGVLLTGGICLSTPRYALPTDVIGDHVCAGTSCAGGETFSNGEEIKLKDTLPILRFEDTDSGDPIWHLEANNGTQKFSLVDKTHTKTPFTIEAGAQTNALYVNNLGRVGIGTSTPAWNLHILASSHPTLRLEQTSPAAVWDLQADENAFYILDSVNFRQPFLIAPNAPSNSFFIASNGNIGLKTTSPQGNLHIFGTAGNDVFNGIGPDPVNGPAFNFGYSGFSFGRGSGFFNVRPDAQAVAPNPSIRFATQNAQRMIITNTGLVGINNLSPSQQLDVGGNIRASGSFISGGTTLNVPDYVFAPDYQLMPLKQLAGYIEKEQHLPEIPSAQDIKAQGIDLSTMQMQLLKKVEELTLYTIAQEETITTQVQTIDQLRGALTDLTARLAVLEQARATEQSSSKGTQPRTQHRH